MNMFSRLFTFWKKSTTETDSKDVEVIIEKFEGSERFGSAEDYSDHFYRNSGCSPTNPLPRNRTKAILKEWKILQNNLPETIYVKVYESKMDIMRAAIIGAKGTPYRFGIFFFDIYFPDNYPSVPPMVYYHAHGMRINPNLYKNGTVCLSLLNTWYGMHRETWTPGVSTILQVLVSIQGLVLNTEPFYNEPGATWLTWIRSLLFSWIWFLPMGDDISMDYNEKVFVKNLKTMVCTIRKPPRNFEDFVRGYFFKNGKDILAICEVYKNGVHVKSESEEGSDAATLDWSVMGKKCSKDFKKRLGEQMKIFKSVLVQQGLF